MPDLKRFQEEINNSNKDIVINIMSTEIHPIQIV